jgi:acetyl-CoA acyltransferase 1
MPMGWTSENVAGDFKITREQMDAWAAGSHQRAERAQKSGVFDAEIIPVTVPTKNADGSLGTKVVSRDDGIREGTTAEGLAKIKGAFKQWAPSQTTGGNASQITDGGAFVLLMTRRKAQELGLPILAKHVTNVSSGLAPRIMGIGPSIAIPKLLEQTGLTKDDIDLFEINEAFSSMMVYCVNKLELDPAKVNVNGGAIALGHPLGCTGARQVATGLNAIKRSGGKLLVTSMCVGLGMGCAGLWVNEQ